MATARKTTTKTTKSSKATPAPVTREELTQITNALTALAREVKTLKEQLSKAESSVPEDASDLKRRIRIWAEKGCNSQQLSWILDSPKV